VRDVDVLPPALAALDAQLAQQAAQRLRDGQGAPAAGQDYVFTGPEGALIDFHHLRVRVWLPALAKAGLRRRTPYQTRHSFASNALEAGESPQWVARMLGHRNAKLLFDRYARWIPNRTRQDGSALAARLGALDGPRNAPQKRPERPSGAEGIGVSPR
jgi:integrase